MLMLSHDIFFGDLQLSRALDGVTLSHRIANSPPAHVPMHTHSDAHFVLITSGDYVSSATGDAHPRTTLILQSSRHDAPRSFLAWDRKFFYSFPFQHTDGSVLGHRVPARGCVLEERSSIWIGLGIADGVCAMEFELAAQSRIALPGAVG